MKIFIPQRAKTGIGGGWSFTYNVQKALRDKVQFIDNWKDCDIYFIPGSTLAEKDEVEQVKKAGKKIVLRIDNVPRNSRNRNTGTSRLLKYSQLADGVIYQSEWARSFIMPFIKKYGDIILNGVDDKIFNEFGKAERREGDPQYLYVRYNRDNTKRWEKAWYDFQTTFYENSKAHLWIVGKFSPENKEYDFDFFGGSEKRYKYWGVIEDREKMAQIYRGADILLLPYFMDACSNVAIEARMCGLKIEWYSYNSGGTSEIMNADKKELTLEFMGNKYLEVFKKIL